MRVPARRSGNVTIPARVRCRLQVRRFCRCFCRCSCRCSSRGFVSLCNCLPVRAFSSISTATATATMIHVRSIGDPVVTSQTKTPARPQLLLVVRRARWNRVNRQNMIRRVGDAWCLACTGRKRKSLRGRVHGRVRRQRRRRRVGGIEALALEQQLHRGLQAGEARCHGLDILVHGADFRKHGHLVAH